MAAFDPSTTLIVLISSPRSSRSDPAVKTVHLHRRAALPKLSQALSLLPQRCQRHSLFGLNLSESPRRLQTSPDGEVLKFKVETARRLPLSIWK